MYIYRLYGYIAAVEMHVGGGKRILCDPTLASPHQHMVRANMKGKKYLRSVDIVLCRNGWHRRSHGERRVRGALSSGVSLYEKCERCCVSF